tara:strand:- start:13570 stop:14145 length:576 start_codon:yes stop_codon:yes gene_type:complete
MTVTQLASENDVEAALGRDLTTEETARIGAILDKASEQFRRVSGQQFTPGSSTVRLKVNGGRVRLPQRPVTAVTSVTDDAGNAVAYTQFKSVLTTSLRSDQFVIVSYTHGATEVPAEVRLCIAELGKRVLEIPQSARSGLSQFAESDGPFSESGTFAAWAVGGQTMLSPDDVALAKSFRVSTGSLIVVSSR